MADERSTMPDPAGDPGIHASSAARSSASREPVGEPRRSSEDELVHRITALVRLADQRWAIGAPAGPARERARALREHAASYLLPRARSLDAPLVVLLLGPTGSGKSTVMNTIAGSRVSATGVLRPTTRDAVLLATAADRAVLLAGGSLAGVPAARLDHAEAGARTGIAILDAPDIDSIEEDNRALADALVEVADLCIFITTATRYADRVPWEVLDRVEERRLPLLVVVNRLPAGADAELVLGDAERLFGRAELTAPDVSGRIELLGIPEGAVEPERESLLPGSLAPILRRIDELGADRTARRALARQALEGALVGTAELVNDVADDLEHEAIDVDALRRIAESAYAEERADLMAELRAGRFLREEVLRQWQGFVGADQVTRLFATGIGRLRGTILQVLRGTPPAPVAEVTEGMASDLEAIAAAHAAEAARRTAGRWAERPEGAALVEADGTLWSASPALRERLDSRLRNWVGEIAADVAESAASKRGLARGASLGINAAGTTVMVGVFAHTGGLTGAEVGVAAATAFLNQKLLHALFGEAAVQDLVGRARKRLEVALDETLHEEQARFDRLLPSAEELHRLAGELRGSVAALPS